MSTDALIAMLDRADTLPLAAALRNRTYDLLEPVRDGVVVDVGCGAGRAVAELRQRGALAVGIDPDEQMITVARQRWPDRQFRVGAAEQLGFGDAEVHGYRADKVFHVLDDPAAALREARRVLVPGGRIVLVGQDWDAIVIDSDDAELTRRIVHARADTLPSPRAARRYRNFLLDTGFTDVTVEAHTAIFTDEMMLPMLSGIAEAAQAAGAITERQAQTWTAEQTERAHAGRMFCALPVFLASAQRPGPMRNEHSTDRSREDDVVRR